MTHLLRGAPALVLSVGMLLLGASAVVSCGGGSSSSSQQPSGGNAAPARVAPTPTPAPVRTITVADNSFEPAQVTVKAGTVIRWVWTGNNPHSVVVSGLTSPQHTGSGTFEQTFSTLGSTIRYQCGVHGASMAGTIVVE